ncbi:MAG TPA: ATP-binding protein [Thermomicrobiales bacterium]|nr:ATP-binding protein [Thermomicrobiales bacterium]
MTAAIGERVAVAPSGTVPREAMEGANPSRRPSARVALLRVPLLGKLIGANLVLFVGAVAGHWIFPSASSTLQLTIALTLSFALTTLLVWLALRPIAQIEATALRVASGDFAARVPDSPLADRDTLRLAVTMNRLLDRVESDRARIQYLAGRSVRARDIERESVARELRDSFAQMVSAIALQMAAAQRVNDNPEVEQQLERTRMLIVQLTEEMRSVAETLYPGTLGEFGLLNAVRALARRTGRQSRVQLEVDGGSFHAPRLTAQAASALYRAADEALRNVSQHADAKHVRVLLHSDDTQVVLEVEDDGRGVDMRSRDPMQAGLGLFSARAVLALAGGELQISSAPDLGTRIVARVPTSTTGNGATRAESREPRADQ